ncbi:MAG: hypothetical protein WDZ79_00815 [Candidatus Paceibacterota bacterium]
MADEFNQQPGGDMGSPQGDQGGDSKSSTNTILIVVVVIIIIVLGIILFASGDDDAALPDGENENQEQVEEGDEVEGGASGEIEVEVQ